MKYYIKPDLYIVFDDGGAKVGQEFVTELSRTFCYEHLLPFLQKWSESKKFHDISTDDVPFLGSNLSFATLTEMMKERSKK